MVKPSIISCITITNVHAQKLLDMEKDDIEKVIHISSLKL